MLSVFSVAPLTFFFPWLLHQGRPFTASQKPNLPLRGMRRTTLRVWALITTSWLPRVVAV